MFVSMVRTSLSIFRAIRPLEPILFDFHFCGYRPLQILKDTRTLTIPNYQKTKINFFRKIANRSPQNFTNTLASMVRNCVPIFRSIRSNKPFLFDFHFSGCRPLKILQDTHTLTIPKKPKSLIRLKVADKNCRLLYTIKLKFLECLQCSVVISLLFFEIIVFSVSGCLVWSAYGKPIRNLQWIVAK